LFGVISKFNIVDEDLKDDIDIETGLREKR